jgi:DNA-binding HxlR family transcriptional regulator
MTNFPYPGKPVRGSKTGKPTMALFDLLGRRWAMGVLWQLCQGGACTFRELQTRCESISPAVLNSRIKDLRQGLLVEHSSGGYQPTELGQQLAALLLPFSEFADLWATHFNEQSQATQNLATQNLATHKEADQ